jgi:hypothetical protein
VMGNMRMRNLCSICCHMSIINFRRSCNMCMCFKPSHGARLWQAHWNIRVWNIVLLFYLSFARNSSNVRVLIMKTLFKLVRRVTNMPTANLPEIWLEIQLWRKSKTSPQRLNWVNSFVKFYYADVAPLRVINQQVTLSFLFLENFV